MNWSLCTKANFLFGKFHSKFGSQTKSLLKAILLVRLYKKCEAVLRILEHRHVKLMQSLCDLLGLV